MKLEVEMYLRTKDGIIDKVIIDYNGHCANPNCEYKHISCAKNYYDEDTVTKASYNIIDLIEVGDLVEIEFYSPRYEKRITRLFEVDFKNNSHITFNNAHCQLNIVDGIWSDADLKPVFKSIVTKEQFENAKYRIGDE